LPYAISVVRLARRKSLTRFSSPCDFRLRARRCRVHCIPHPTFVTIAIRPSFRGGTTRTKSLIWGSRQASTCREPSMAARPNSTLTNRWCNRRWAASNSSPTGNWGIRLTTCLLKQQTLGEGGRHICFVRSNGLMRRSKRHPYSIASSARTSHVGGSGKFRPAKSRAGFCDTPMPSAIAVLRLTTNSKPCRRQDRKVRQQVKRSRRSHVIAAVSLESPRTLSSHPFREPQKYMAWPE